MVFCHSSKFVDRIYRCLNIKNILILSLDSHKDINVRHPVRTGLTLAIIVYETNVLNILLHGEAIANIRLMQMLPRP